MNKKFYEDFPNKLKVAQFEELVFLNSFTLSPN